MYLDYFGLKELPFSIAPDPRYLYMSERHREALAHLLYGVSGQGGFIVLTGEVGTGKTTICRCFLHQVPKNTDVAFIVNPKLSARELLASICDEFGIDYPPSASIKILNDVLNKYLLKAHADGRHTVLIIDEAQNLRIDVLEQLRLLTNLETSEKKLLQIILLGQPELREMLAQTELRQLAQRVTARYHLSELNKMEVGAYVQCRLAVAGCKGRLFSLSALNKLYRLSHGVPRLINLIADRALLGAYASQSEQVEAGHVSQAYDEINGKDFGKTLAFTPIHILAIAATIVVVASGWLFYPATNKVIDSFSEWSQTALLNEDALESKESKANDSAENVLLASSGDSDSANRAQSNAPAKTVSTEASEPEPTAVETFEVAMASKVSADPKTGAPEKANFIENFQQALSHSADTVLAYAEAASPENNKSTTSQDLPPPSEKFPFLKTLGDRQSDRLGKYHAFASVFDRWNIDYPEEPFRLACDYAEVKGLRCLHKNGNWRSLLRLDRPAVLTLFNEQGDEIYLALRRIEGDHAEVSHNGERFWVSLEEIDRHWLGEYSLLWRLPPYKSNIIQPGQESEEVWLRRRFDELAKSQFTGPLPQLSDESLKLTIQRFQKQVGLVPDGIAGSMTIIHLHNILGSDCPSLLGKT